MSRASVRRGDVLPYPEVADHVLLKAKADVCDAYRDWLADTTRANRLRISAALKRVHELEVTQPTLTQTH